MQRIDLNIVEEDLLLDSFKHVSQLTNADVVAQDIKHRIVESGLLPPLIKQRNVDAINKLIVELELIVEQDARIMPGTVTISATTTGLINIHAQTRDYHGS